jgi:hypothetical protein
MKLPKVKQITELQVSDQVEGVRVGHIVKVTKSGDVLVDFPGNTRGPLLARYTRALRLDILQQSAKREHEVLLAFENNDPQKPIITDILHSLLDEVAENGPLELQAGESDEVSVDGRRITFNAKEEIELRCGKASIILTRAGKIIIRGAYLLNRSSGVNRIKGGSVQIN